MGRGPRGGSDAGLHRLATIPVMAIVAVLVFALLRLTAGDPAAIIAGSAATTQDVESIRAKPRP